MPAPTPVLIVDDDASHLKLYSLLVEGDGFQPVPLLVKGNSIQLPSSAFKIAIVDYKLGMLTAVDVAIEIRKLPKTIPILLLTDMMWMPDDFKPYAAAFVRKGEPELLLSTLKSLAA